MEPKTSDNTYGLIDRAEYLMCHIHACVKRYGSSVYVYDTSNMHIYAELSDFKLS